MSFPNKFTLSLVLALVSVFTWAGPSAVTETSPWDGLQPQEYRAAAELIKALHGDDVLFTRISLRQPDKTKALAWREGTSAQRDADVTFLVNGAARLARLDLTANKVGSDAPMRGGQPMISGTGELEPLVVTLS